jgi:5'-deoxynucleotidase YfbR-like HD superfamily hydrolase
MDPRTLLDVINIAARLKDTTRHCYTEKGRHESVAEHCWMTTLMALFMKDEFPEAVALRISTSDYREQDWLVNIPLYTVCRMFNT